MTTDLNAYQKHIPLMLRTLENSLRGGHNLMQSLEKVSSDVPAPLGTDAQIAVDELKRGVSFQECLSRWLERTPSPDLDLVFAAFAVQLESGGNLADKLNLLGQIMQKRSL